MSGLLLSKEEVLKILKETGGIREGHFILPSGIHTNLYFQMPLAFRYFDNVRRLSVALSRLLRLCGPVAKALPDCTVVAPASGGIPVAFAVREALGASQILWAERRNDELYFRPTLEVKSGDRCILVDDIVLTSRTLKNLSGLVRQQGGRVLAAGVIVDPGLTKLELESIPFVSLLRLEAESYPDASVCALCRAEEPATRLEF
ncbi:MAG: orotate phosphoribosyltransferase [Acidobacteriota bacterium]